jgi:Protein of unknown function (DUF4235)
VAKQGNKSGDGGKLESIALNLYTGAVAAIAGAMARKAVESAWRKMFGRMPPNEPESLEVHWAEAVGWSALSGTAVAVVRLMATRKATGVWVRANGKQSES